MLVDLCDTLDNLPLQGSECVTSDSESGSVAAVVVSDCEVHEAIAHDTTDLQICRSSSSF